MKIHLKYFGIFALALFLTLVLFKRIPGAQECFAATSKPSAAITSASPIDPAGGKSPPKTAASSGRGADSPPSSDSVLVMDGKIYPQDSFPENCKDLTKGAKCAVEPFGHFHTDSKKEGELIHNQSFFSDADGSQVTEESWQKDGHVQKAIVNNRALGKLCELEVKDGKVFYKTTDTDGTVKTSKDDLDDNLVVPSTVLAYVRPRFQEIMKGEAVKLKVAVLDRRESFTFTMKKIRLDKMLNGDDLMVMEFKPTSVFVQALVDPMLFYIQLKTGQMFAFEGKSALRRKVDGKYKEMNVKTEYTTSVDTFKMPSVAPPCDATQVMGKCELKEGTPSENKTTIQN